MNTPVPGTGGFGGSNKNIGIGNDDCETTAYDVTKDIEPEWTPDCFNVFFGRNNRRPE